jgi:DNA-binding transcriptional LysR family regulator
MNVQQLRYLIAAADTGSISGAARVERVSQPVVSRALHALEQELAVDLFRKDGRRNTLTDAGQAVAAAARQVLTAIEGVHRTARLFSAEAELVVVATPTNSILLSPIVAGYLKQQPAVSLRLRRAGDMVEVARMVSDGDADLGFGDLDVDPIVGSANAGLLTRPLWDAHVVLVSPYGSDLPNSVPVARLGELHLVLPPDGSDRRADIESLISDAGGQQPKATLATDERSAWTTSAQQGVASYLTYEAVGVELDGVDLRPLDPPVRTHVGFIHRTGKLPAAGEALLDLAWQCEAPAGCTPVRHDRKR